MVGFVALAVGLVLLASILPSAGARRTAEKERKLVVLQRVSSPVPLGEAAVVARPYTYSTGADSPEPRRYVRVHHFARLGQKLASAGAVLETFYVGDARPDLRPSTNLHLAFDPKDENALHLALAYAVGVKQNNDAISNVVRTDLGAGTSTESALKHRAVQEVLASVAKGRNLNATERDRLEDCLRSEAVNPSGFAPGMRVFEVAGRLYIRRDPKSLIVSDQDIVEALADPKVRLP